MHVGVLGGLCVVRSDGVIVDPAAWRTGKTMDLLRILALENGHVVPATRLVGLLWPDVDPAKGRASLNKASSRIRAAVGHPCVKRQDDGLVLVAATVDVDRLRALATAVRDASARSAWDDTKRLSDAAEKVYRGDFRAHDDNSTWAVFAREDMRRLRLRILSDTARCATQNDQLDDALELSRAMAFLDPASESSHRSLMCAHASLGDVGQALRVFEHHRAWLARELGMEPSRSTLELRARLMHDCDH